MMSRSVVLCALAAMLTATAWGQEAWTVSFGPWTAAVDGAGLRSLQWQGEESVQAGGMAAYLPGWAGGRFGIEGSELTVGDRSATWHRDIPGNQVATMSRELSPERATLSLDTTIHTDGPTEFWVQIVPDTGTGGWDARGQFRAARRACVRVAHAGDLIAWHVANGTRGEADSAPSTPAVRGLIAAGRR